MMISSTTALHMIALRGSVIIGPAQQDREENYWLSKAIDGDETAYRWLLGRYRDRVVRIAAATLGGPSEAEDAAQEAFIRAFRTIKKLENKSSFYGWITRITIRICLDKKRLKRAQEVQLTDECRSEPVNDRSAATMESILIRQVLGQLTPPMRAALVLRELDGLEYEEVAQLLHIPVGTVRSRLSSARAKFRDLWELATAETEGFHADYH